MSGLARRKTKVIKIGSVRIGGNYPLAIQSMLKVKTENTKLAVKQINELKSVGCEIVRVAIKDVADARALKMIKRETDIPLVADIHFDWRLALEAINSGVDKIRLNPGNIYKKEEVCDVARAAKLNHIPIRVGINSGSLEGHKGTRTPEHKGTRAQEYKPIEDRMVKSALDYIRMLEGFGFYDIVVSLKASNTLDTINAYRKMADLCAYPLHLGVTATGLPFSGAIKSSVAVGILLFEGIGDTIRISLTDNPQEEVKAAKAILEALGLRNFGPEIISCPTCGRCEVNLIKIVRDLERKIIESTARSPCLTGRQARPTNGSGRLLTVPAKNLGGSAKHCGGDCRPPLKVAMMGCVVNGPGEAKEADIGVAFGKKEGLLFKKGKPVRKVSFENCIDVLLKEIVKGNK